MTNVLLTLDLVFIAVAFGARTLVQRRRTGDSGWRLGRPHSAGEAVGRGLMLAAALLIVVATATADPRFIPVAWVGLALAIGSVTLVAVAQLEMGASWRIGVDPDERTALITSGVYARIRNPIYTGMVACAIGQALALRSAWAVAASAALIVGVHIQVRAVEEPYLVRLHGEAYATWAQRSGRFAPWIGRSARIE